ncbi:antitoxin Xre/MbcA/ParS toxin-binding domain-containing protein [Paracraurococcus lichenis]|uniref:DUF2384 domain-containing protein n=1 Tax=Paracraurococcus lichenis TaxID=3064888 RepID=A0ABT9EDN3_9PROT|nr:antitoxin Xre/MbcA/ParS toxin-binding domain-containing protein [Paracraurococcus sp. LOR1-02]MDO9714083.1 DUF2384 domain-containing protein [Paracraurococcus sp. LOR1-02]
MSEPEDPDDFQALQWLIEQRQAKESVDLEYAAVLDAATDTWGSMEDAHEWLHRPHALLGDRTPAAVATEGDAGRQQVLDILGPLRAGTAP